MAAELEAQEAYKVISIGDASSDTYPETLIIDQTDSGNKALIIELASELNAAIVTTIPSGEAASAAGVIIIIGGAN